VVHSGNGGALRRAGNEPPWVSKSPRGAVERGSSACWPRGKSARPASFAAGALIERTVEPTLTEPPGEAGHGRPEDNRRGRRVAASDQCERRTASVSRIGFYQAPRDVVGFYLDPRSDSLVLSLGEKRGYAILAAV
jgi:hypothetical protein